MVFPKLTSNLCIDISFQVCLHLLGVSRHAVFGLCDTHARIPWVGSVSQADAGQAGRAQAGARERRQVHSARTGAPAHTNLAHARTNSQSVTSSGHSLRSSRKSLYQLPIYIYVFSIGITVVSRCRVLQSKSGMLHYFTLRRFLHTPQTRHADTSRAQSRDLASHCHTCLFSLSTCMFTVWLPSTISPLHYILLVRVDRA